MEFWSLLGQSKLEGVTLFRNVNHKGVDTVLVTVAHSNCPVEHTSTGLTCVKLKDIASVISTNGKEEYKILQFSAFYETAEFTGDQSYLLGKSE